MLRKWILRNIALMLSIVLFITSSAQTTYGFITAVTEPLVNIFVPTEIPDESFLSITGEKVLSGREWTEKDSFDFVLERKLQEGNWAELGRKTVAYSADDSGFNKFDFGNIREFFTDPGTYELRLYEEKGSAEGISYDDTVYYILVTAELYGDSANITAVSVNGKEIASENGKFEVKAVFENTYSAPGSAKAVINVRKEFAEGSSFHSPEGFEFVLNETTPGREKKYTAFSDGEGFANFDVYFDKAGEYTFELFESAGKEDGMTYDDRVYVFTAFVEEEDGKLVVKGINEEPFVFTNNYEAPKGKINVNIGISVEVINDRTPPTDLSIFSFVIYGKGLVETGEVIGMNSEGKVFLPFVFYEDEVGTYTYTISQIIPEEGSYDRIDGLSYDSSEHVMTIEIIKNEDGSLEAIIRVEGEIMPAANAHFKFINRFPGETEIEVPVKITKTVENKTDKPAPETAFDFIISDSPDGENILASDSVVLAEGEHSAETTLEFVLDEKYIGSHTFYIREVDGGEEGWSYSENPISFTTKIRNDGNEEAPDLVLEEIVFNGASVDEIKAEIVNIFGDSETEKIKVPLIIRKHVKIIGDEKIGPEEFEFLIENLTSETERRVRTDENGGFETYLEFSEEDVGKTFEYRVKEIKGGKKGVTYDDSVYDISVSIIRGSDGIKAGLSVNGFVTSRLEFTFENIYNPSAAPSEDGIVVPIIIKKSVINTGEKEIGPSGFKFVIEQVTENGVNAYSETKLTDINGTAIFNLVFEKGDIGEVYEYTVREISGDIEGMEYDKTVYKVEIGVYPGGENGIGIAIYVNGEETTEAVLEFENKFEFKDERNPETGVFNPLCGIITMIFSGIMFVCLVITDKRFKITR